jgi:hypothetical protein
VQVVQPSTPRCRKEYQIAQSFIVSFLTRRNSVHLAFLEIFKVLKRDFCASLSSLKGEAAIVIKKTLIVSLKWACEYTGKKLKGYVSGSTDVPVPLDLHLYNKERESCIIYL